MLTLLAACLLVPGGAYAAGHVPGGRMHDQETYWDRALTRAVAAYEDTEAELYARLERERQRIEERLADRRSQLCKRYEHVAKHTGIVLVLPDFCGEPAVVVQPVEVPLPVVVLTADPAAISAGESSTLTWTSTDADTCTAEGVWTASHATSGTALVTPDATTTYRMECTNVTGVASDTATVRVTLPVSEPEPLPDPTVTLTADPLSVDVGGSATLSWTSTDATQCIAPGGWTDVQGTSGTAPVVVDETTEYTLSCGNGMATATASVTVEATPIVVGSSDVRINEVAWMGTSNSTGDEWIELYNAGTVAQDLTGWTLTATSGNISVTLLGTIGAGAYFLLERTDDTSVPTVVADQIYTGGLSNSGEVLELRDPDGVLVDTVDGSESWAIGGDKTNFQTLQRVTDTTWTTALATPKGPTL